MPFILFPRAVGLSLFDAIVSACCDAGFEPQLSQEAPQISSVVNLVAAELGVSIVPASIEQVEVKGVRYIDIEGPAPLARLALATREDKETVLVHNFVALASMVSPSSEMMHTDLQDLLAPAFEDHDSLV
jgi:DNA-binding transcriptional LysR family regulator